MEPKKPSPPALFIRFFRWFCHPELKRYIEGDLMELYDERLKASGKKKADLQFVADVLLLFRPGIIRPVNGYQSVNNYAMFKSYFKIGWRNLLRSKGYSFINIGGLALGMTVAMLIGLWIYDELSYDRNFRNFDRIARVMQNQVFNGEIETWGNQALQLGPELRNVYGSNFDHVIMASGRGDHKLVTDEKRISASGQFMEPAVTDMLTLKMVEGTASGLHELNSILLSQTTAKALFGNETALGKTIRADDNLDVKVTGVYEDLPANCSFASLHIIMPWELLVKTQELEKRVSWGNSWFQCMVQIAPNTTMTTVSQNIKEAKLKRVLVEDDDARFKPELFLHPMSRWHLYSDFENGVSTGGAIQYVWMFGVVGAFVLFLACINFMNLSTARSERRAKEVGIRKTIGSVRAQLVNQFFTESLLVALLAFAFSIVMVQLALPWFNEVAGKRITILWTVPGFWMACIAFALVTGIIAGSYPALYLSSFQAVKVLKGTFRAGRYAAIPRKVLVVVQFTVSVTLIVSTIIIFRQIQFAQSRPVGYSQNGLILVPIKTNEIMNHFDVLRNELLKTHAVKEVSASEGSITETWTTNSGFQWDGKDPNTTEEFVTIGITHDFGKTIGWQVKQGRDFSIEMATDSSGFIINEAAAEYLG
ncbi:MAG TPA: ABC transporter permease, partial [Chitinophagaceae bacterium]|nr:ABC transporter permease [Chitinophagaceae bacterium]